METLSGSPSCHAHLYLTYCAVVSSYICMYMYVSYIFLHAGQLV